MHLPSAGDIVWVNLDPVEGTEQAGRRPALILTPRSYHAKAQRSVVCPITSRSRDWPWEVQLPDGLKTKGVVLVDQIRTIDRARRMLGFVEPVPDDVLSNVLGKLASLLGVGLSLVGADR